MSDLQIATRAAKIDRIRATHRFSAFAVLTQRAIEKISAGRMTASEGPGTSSRWPGPTGCARPAYDPKLVEMFIARVQHTKEI
jgi:hypothetical protein